MTEISPMSAERSVRVELDVDEINNESVHAIPYRDKEWLCF